MQDIVDWKGQVGMLDHAAGWFRVLVSWQRCGNRPSSRVRVVLHLHRQIIRDLPAAIP